MEGTQLPEGCEGAIVNVYVGAVDIRAAMERAELSLLADFYRPVKIMAAFELDLEGTDFDTEEGYPGNADLQDIKNNSEVWYGPFYTFPPDEGKQCGSEH